MGDENNNDNNNGNNDGGPKRDNVHKLLPFMAEKNKRAGAGLGIPTQTVTGMVTFVADLRSQAAVAFRVRHGREETMFWISTAKQETERDYRIPLSGETVKVSFNDKAQPLYIPGEGEPAKGVTKMENVSENSEQAAFRWFREHYPEAYAPKKPDGDKGPKPK